MMTPTYNPWLVLVSLLISVVAAWLALELSNRVHAQHRLHGRVLWLALGSGAMGIGIWAMHYVGMLAYRSGMPMQYHWPTVVLSLVAAVVASAAALHLVSRAVLPLWMVLLGSLFMGTGIAAMHYIGMEAMRMPVAYHYSMPMVALSVVLAVVISFVALQLCYRSREDTRQWSRRKLATAVLMGSAIPTMHYVGMAAMKMDSMQPGMTMPHYAHTIAVGGVGTICIVIGVLLVLLLVLLLSALNRDAETAEHTIAEQRREQSEMNDYQQRLLQAFRRAGGGAWECDPRTGVFLGDSSLRAMYGLDNTPSPVPREVWRARVHPDDLQHLDRRWRAAMDAGTVYENEYRVVLPTGGTRVYRSVASIARDEQGSAVLVTGMTWDVTQERQQQQAFHKQEERFQRTLEAIADAVIAVNEHNTVVYVNPVAAQMLGFTRMECLGQPLTGIFVVEDEQTGERRSDPIKRCIALGGRLLSESGVMVTRHGKRYNIRKRVTLLERDGAVITFQDITAEHASAKALQHAATHDALTGLPNRAAFEAHLAETWDNERAPGQTHCLCLLDLDRFKIVNDTSGHMAGDALLKQVVRLFRSHLADGDMLGRMGGDEFLMLLHNTTRVRAQVWVQRVLHALEKMRFEWEGQTYSITASVGLVEFDHRSKSRDTLISEADMAMFSSKRGGRNQVVVFEQADGSMLQEMETLGHLRLALEENRFELHAQPIVSVHLPGEKTYFELLVRMRGEDNKLVPPNLFIPPAEKYGMMDQLDRWVIRHALQEYGGHPLLGDLRFAINLSGQSLSDPGLWPFVFEQFRETGVPPQTITFEVTETGIIENMETATSFLQQVRRLGCRVALDDFGTGMSSLSYLKQFTLDYLKIDGSFIKQLNSGALDQSIVRATAQIAHTMKALTVGECAEDMQTVELLQQLGVDFVQGWATGRPQLLQEVLREHAARQSAQPAPYGTSNSERGRNERGSIASGPFQPGEWKPALA